MDKFSKNATYQNWRKKNNSLSSTISTHMNMQLKTLPQGQLQTQMVFLLNSLNI